VGEIARLHWWNDDRSVRMEKTINGKRLEIAACAFPQGD